MKIVSSCVILFFTCMSITQTLAANSLIPLYIWPVDSSGNCSPEWKKVINSAVATKISIIVNPANGPVSKTTDSWTWTVYDKCIKEVRAKGVKVYGYVHTKTGFETGTLNGWRDPQKYTIDGIFIDETSTRWLLSFETSRADTVKRYQDYTNYILAKNNWSVFLNPGTPFFEELLTYKADTRIKIVIKEDQFTLWNPSDGCLSHLWTKQQGSFRAGVWCPFVPNWDGIEPLKTLTDSNKIQSQQLAVMVYNHPNDANQVSQSFLLGKNDNIGYFYFTDKSVWSALPSDTVWNALQTNLAQLALLQLSETEMSEEATTIVQERL